MRLAWGLVQLVFWLDVIGLIVVSFAVVALAPPFVAGRCLWRRFVA